MKKVEAGVDHKVQKTLEFALKKLGEANPDIIIEIPELCAMVASEDEDGTPLTGGSTSF